MLNRELLLLGGLKKSKRTYFYDLTNATALPPPYAQERASFNPTTKEITISGGSGCGSSLINYRITNNITRPFRVVVEAVKRNSGYYQACSSSSSIVFYQGAEYMIQPSISSNGNRIESNLGNVYVQNIFGSFVKNEYVFTGSHINFYENDVFKHTFIFTLSSIHYVAVQLHNSGGGSAYIQGTAYMEYL